MSLENYTWPYLRQKNNCALNETKSQVNSILENKTLDEIKTLSINFLKSWNTQSVLELIDANFDVENWNIIINHWNFYRDISWNTQRSNLINIYPNKEENFKKVFYLLVKIFWTKLSRVNDKLAQFIDDENLKKIILSWDFEYKIHNFKLIKKETI